MLPARHVEPERPLEHAFQRTRVTVRGPQLQFCVTRGPKSHQIRVSFRDDVDGRDDLRMTPVEPLGQPEHRGERAHSPAERPFQHDVPLVRFLRCRLAVIPRQQRDDLDLLRIEPPQLAILDQVIRVAMMPFVTDMDPGIVEQRPVFEPLALWIAEAVDRTRLIEDR